MACVTRVCFQDVDISGAHLFWSEPPPTAMRESIRSMGQLEPVLARFHGGRWHVISGRRRVLVLAETGADILVIEASGPPDPLTDGLLYLHANTHRPLDDGLRVRAVRYFQPWMEPGELAWRIAPFLGLEPRSGIWHRLMAWLALPAHWDKMLSAGRLPLACGPILAGLDQEDAAAVEPYFHGLKWSQSRAVQWLSWLVETSKREGKSLGELLERMGAPAVLDGDCSPQDKLKRLLLWVRTLRYPALTSLEERFQALRRELAGRSRWELVPSEGFETDAVELRLRARNTEEVRAGAQALERLASSERLPELFTIAR